MISVLPRFSADGEIEMSLNIEDGNEEKQSVSGNEDSVLPEVGRTHISTVARVPQGKSLLIGDIHVTVVQRMSRKFRYWVIYR